jgi:hypothetical protein
MRLGMNQAFDEKIRFDGRPMGEDGTSLFGQTQPNYPGRNGSDNRLFVEAIADF